MSIVNIVIERDRALIGVDTLAAFMPEADAVMSEDERQDRHTGKVSFLPQINCAVTGRGDHLLIHHVHFQLAAGAVRGFDQAVQFMPELLAVAFSNAMTYRLMHVGEVTFPGADVVLVGWSSSLLRFEAMRWTRRTEAEEFVATRIERVLMLPEIDQIEEVETPDNPARMQALMRRQLAWVDREHPGNAGGRLLLAELRHGETSVRDLGSIKPTPV